MLRDFGGLVLPFILISGCPVKTKGRRDYLMPDKVIISRRRDTFNNVTNGL